MAGTKSLEFQCPLCPRSYKIHNSLRRHVKDYHEEPGQTFQCPKCPKSLWTTESFRKHQQTVHNNVKVKSSTSHVCPLCQKRFYGPTQLMDHRRTHTGERPHVCFWCDNVAFSHFVNLASHIRSVHTKERPFQCDLCSKSFSRTSDLHRHRATHQDDRERLFQCPKAGCQRKYKSKLRLMAHFNASLFCNPNASVQKFICPMCLSLKSFPTRAQLNSHIRTHIGEKPFCCTFCLKIFKTNGELRAHVQGHSGERPYACSKCHWKA